MTAHVTGGDLSRLRQLNALSAIRTLRDEPPQTLTELSRRIGLSRASTEDVVRELLALGWVAEVEARDSPIRRASSVSVRCGSSRRVRIALCALSWRRRERSNGRFPLAYGGLCL